MESGLVTKQSSFDFEETYSRLRTIIDNNPNLKIILELDHSKNAGSVDLTLRPTKIIMFGNPKLGTPLMNSSATASLDLPQKIVVFTDEKGLTHLTYNDPNYLMSRHNIEGQEAVLQKVSGALNKITNAAISNGE
jgi:uncharacterized protein (DUF302 family)